MVDFEALLQESLVGVNEAFKQADTELHEVVGAVSQALGKLSNNAVELKLVKYAEDLEGTSYELTLEELGKFGMGSVPVGAYQVSARGYPIRVGDIDRPPVEDETIEETPETFKASSELATQADLEAHFTDLMSKPDSLVITNAAFFMRRAPAAPH